MAFDAVSMYYSAVQIRQALMGGRVDKIHQLSAEELVISFGGTKNSGKLFISARANAARVHLTAQTFENPQKPPMFCMLLRKHLVGGRLLGVRQPDSERILYFDFECTNELRDKVQLTLAVETMGRHSNICLVDSQNKIIDSIKRVDFTMSSVRQVLPGMCYVAPPPVQGKCSLFTDTPHQIASKIASCFDGDLSKAVMRSVAGISPIVAGEISHQVTKNLPVDQLSQDQMDKLLFVLKTEYDIKNTPCQPCIVFDQAGAPKDLCFGQVHAYSYPYVTKSYPDMGSCLDQYFSAKDTYFRVRSRSDDLFASILQKTQRIIRKQAAQKQQLLESEQRDIYKVYGDLINTYMGQICKGQSSVVLQNFYDQDNQSISVPLDVRLTPAQNAQAHYKKYKKLTTAYGMLQDMIDAEQKEIMYLKSVFDSLSRALGEEDIMAIQAELVETGYLKKGRGKGLKPRRRDPISYELDDGFLALVGRNNLQNDLLTFKMATRFDIWFHTTDIPGSHVILFTDGLDFDSVPERAFTQAAVIAATHSQGGSGQSRIRVDYTLVKNVKKPVGAKPGMVIFSQNYSAYVTADQELCQRLKKDKTS